MLLLGLQSLTDVVKGTAAQKKELCVAFVEALCSQADALITDELGEKVFADLSKKVPPSPSLLLLPACLPACLLVAIHCRLCV